MEPLEIDQQSDGSGEGNDHDVEFELLNLDQHHTDEMLGPIEFHDAVQTLILFIGSVAFTYYDLYKGIYVYEDHAQDNFLNWFWFPTLLSGVLNVVLLVVMFPCRLEFLHSNEHRRVGLLCLLLTMPLMQSITEIAMQRPGFADSCMLLFVTVTHHAPSKFGIRRSFIAVAIGTVIYVISHIINFALDTSSKGYERLFPYFAWWMLQHYFSFLPQQLQLKNYRLSLKFKEEQKMLTESVKKSTALLERVLPVAMIPRVKLLATDDAIADEFNCVTIIFAKVLGIHELFKTLPTVVQVVEVIDNVYKRVDSLTDQYKIEKIKTVGDTYMAGAGLPEPDSDHALNMANFAFALIDAIKDFNTTNILQRDLGFKIGIASGEVVAGIIGTHVYTYDLWGDAANTASRMYSFGVKGRIQTTKLTTELLKDEFQFQSRGEIKVKGKGMLECFLFGKRKTKGMKMWAKLNEETHLQHKPKLLQVAHRASHAPLARSNSTVLRRTLTRGKSAYEIADQKRKERARENQILQTNMHIIAHLGVENEDLHHTAIVDDSSTTTNHSVTRRTISRRGDLGTDPTDQESLAPEHAASHREEHTLSTDFLSPIRAVCHTIRTMRLQRMERLYNMDRKESINSQLQMLWLLLIVAVFSIANYFIGYVGLKQSCVDPVVPSQSWWIDAEVKCSSLVYCSAKNTTAACLPGAPVRAYSDAFRDRAEMMMTCIVLPLSAVYVFTAQFAFDVRLEAFAGLIEVSVAIAFMILAIENDLYAWFFLMYLAMINTYSTVQYFFTASMSIMLSIVYVTMTLMHFCPWSNASNLVHGGKLCIGPLNFVVEKFVHVVLVSILIGYKLDSRQRGLFMKLKGTETILKTIRKEQGKHDELIALPTVLREGLKNGKSVVLDAYGTILFADIVSFTVFSQTVPPMRLVQILNDMFAMHDELAQRVGVDKVKTLGDCYVACSGVLSPMANHASSMVQFGIGMHWVMERLNERYNLNGKGPFGLDLRIRVGMSSGPIVGGVVGGKKYIFDVWGDTVEDAEIMESGGVPERTHVSHSTYVRAMKEPTLRFEPLGRLPEEGYKGGKTYLALVPNDVNAWLGMVCGEHEKTQSTIPMMKRRSEQFREASSAWYDKRNISKAGVSYNKPYRNPHFQSQETAKDTMTFRTLQRKAAAKATKEIQGGNPVHARSSMI
jgi:class 3 adenylate cyclase